MAGRSSNECLEIENVTSLADAAAGITTLTNSLIGCQEAVKGTLANGDALTEWALGANPSTNGADYTFNAGNTIVADVANANVAILVPGTYFTATTLTDAAGVPIASAPASGQLGAVTAADDWTANWTYGLKAANRGQPLWFEWAGFE